MESEFINPLGEEGSRAAYEERYVLAPRFHLISDSRLRHQLVDFGVHSGPAVAIHKLQGILKVKQDGILGPKTLAAIDVQDPVVLNNKLALERIRMIGKIVQEKPSQAKFVQGWLNRALDFFQV